MLPVLEMSYEQDGIMPPALAARPDLSRSLYSYLEFYHFLKGFRTYNMGGPNPLDYTTLLTFAKEVGIKSVHDRLHFIRMIHLCDSIFIAEDIKRSRPSK